MPIEIRELVIKATIGSSKSSDSEPRSGNDNAGLDEERLIKKVVEKVMEMIKLRSDR